MRYESRFQEFMQFLNDAGNNIHEIKRLYDANINSYSEFEKELIDIVDIYSGIESCIDNIVTNQNGTLTEHDRYFLLEKFRDIYDELALLHNKILAKMF